MQLNRTKNATRNIFFGIIQKIYTLLVPFIIRTAMIHFMGVKYLGLGSLFTSILSVLNLTELGVGSAMVFSMYKPIIDDDTKKICALMRLYRTYYRIIGSIILVVGILLTPIIPSLVKGDLPDGINLIILYYLNLFATVLTYFLFAYKNSILGAYQRNDITIKINLIITTLQYGLQLITIIIGNYYAYVIVALFTTALGNIVTALVVNKLYPQYKATGTLDKSEVKTINQRIRDLFTSKIGAVIVDSADTLVISAFLGLEILAIYNNYYYILTSLFGFIGILFASCTAGIGNSLIAESKEKNYNDFKKFLLIISWITGVCTACLLSLFQPFMKIWVGDKLMLSISMVVCLCIYFFVHEINRLMTNYKDAAGMWHEDRFRPFITAMTNLILNLFLVQFIGLFGILLSTVLSTIFVGMPWLTYNLFTVIFNRSALDFIKSLFKYIFITLFTCIICYFIVQYIYIDGIIGFTVKGCIAFAISNILFFICLHKTKDFLAVKNMIKLILKSKKKNG